MFFTISFQTSGFSVIKIRNLECEVVDRGVKVCIIFRIIWQVSSEFELRFFLQELVVALQWMVLLFENSFLSVALQEEGRTPQMAALAGLMFTVLALKI
jgi:hypothetical protein